jgi:putative (di)nucleoside polyphosphate hydrolase
MLEEIGTNNAKIIKISDQWIKYEIPEKTLKTLPWGEKYIGQQQKWFAFRFGGKDKEINVGTENPEFSEWKWAKINSIIDNIVPFKRHVYSKVLKEFKELF